MSYREQIINWLNGMNDAELENMEPAEIACDIHAMLKLNDEETDDD